MFKWISKIYNKIGKADWRYGIGLIQFTLLIIYKFGSNWSSKPNVFTAVMICMVLHVLFLLLSRIITFTDEYKENVLYSNWSLLIFISGFWQIDYMFDFWSRELITFVWILVWGIRGAYLYKN